MNIDIRSVLKSLFIGGTFGLSVTIFLKYVINKNINSDIILEQIKASNEEIAKLETNFVNFTSPFFNSNLNKKKKIKRKTKPKIDNNIYIVKQFKLKGIYAGTGDDFVIIEYKDKDNFVNKGEKFKGFLLKSIKNNFIILKKNNKEYKLYLIGLKKNNKTFKIINQKEQYKIENKINLENKKIIEPKIFSRIRRIEKIERKKLLNIKNNLKYIWKNIGIKKVDNGYKITYINYNSIFGKLGLKPGDELLSINGQNLLSDQSAWDLYKNIGKFNTVRLKVKTKNGKLKFLVFQIN